jgi:hypothetical protein
VFLSLPCCQRRPFWHWGLPSRRLAWPPLPLAPAKPAVVLVNQPVKALCAGHKFTVGVWYQKFSGGSRAYRISISGPRHLRFFYRSGMASAAHWQMWKVRAGRRGQYRIVYSGHKPGSAKWSKYRVVVTAKHCVK